MTADPYTPITMLPTSADHGATLTRSPFRATKPLYKGEDGNEYGRTIPPERAGGGVKPGAGGGPKILPEPPTESEGLVPRR